MQSTRRFARYRLGVPVTFSWKDQQGMLQQGRGVARDLSAGGVFLLTRMCPPLGVPIQFEALLPPLDPGARTLRMLGEGRVLRVERGVKGKEGDGFAAVSRNLALWDMERKFSRHRVEIPVIFSWTDERGLRQRAKGLARDLSPGGAFLLTRRSPPVGAPIRLEAFLPPLGPGAPTLRMQIEGRVLRIETIVDADSQRWSGVAAVSESVVLQDME